MSLARLTIILHWLFQVDREACVFGSVTARSLFSLLAGLLADGITCEICVNRINKCEYKVENKGECWLTMVSDRLGWCSDKQVTVD